MWGAVQWNRFSLFRGGVLTPAAARMKLEDFTLREIRGAQRTNRAELTYTRSLEQSASATESSMVGGGSQGLQGVGNYGLMRTVSAGQGRSSVDGWQ